MIEGFDGLATLQRFVSRRVENVRARLQDMVLRGVIKLVDDDGGHQKTQVQTDAEDVTWDDTEHVQPYGMSFRPPDDGTAECLRLHLGAEPEDVVSLLASVRGHRPTGLSEPGTGGLYYMGEFKVYLDENGVVHLGGDRDAEDFVALAQLVLDELNDIRSQFDSHIHTTTATVGTGGPPGVISPPTAAMGPAGDVAATATKAT
jgi:hypothetical protein